MEKNSRAKTWAAGSALVGVGLIVGTVAAGTITANAASTTSPPQVASGSTTAPGGPRGPGGQGGPGDSATSVRPDEQLLTGEIADKVKNAALAKYPDATVIRIETDSDGTYEAHLRKADGIPVTVELDKSFAITGEEAGGPLPGGAPGQPNGQPPTSNG